REIVVGVDERQTFAVAINERRQRWHLRDQTNDGEVSLLRIEDVLRVGIERRERRDRAAQHRHRVRVVPESLEKVFDVLVHVRVVRDVVHPLLVLLGRRQLAVTEQPGRLEERCALGELLDGISAIAKNALVAVDVGDRTAARRGVQEGGIVAERPELVGRLLDLTQVHGAHGAIGDRKVVRFARATVGDGQGVGLRGCSSLAHASFPQDGMPLSAAKSTNVSSVRREYRPCRRARKLSELHSNGMGFDVVARGRFAMQNGANLHRHASRIEWPVFLAQVASRSRPISESVAQPHSAMAVSSSSRSVVSTRATPASPSSARPHNTGRPTSAARAPSAIALSTSVPRLTPPSTSTGTLEPAPSTTSARARIVGIAVSSWRPPWLDTIRASTPCSAARFASSPRITPLSTSGSGHTRRSHARSFHVTLASWRAAKYMASAESRSALPVVAPPFPAIMLANAMPGGGWNVLRTSRSRRPNTGVSTVKTSAPYPQAATRSSIASVSARS